LLCLHELIILGCDTKMRGIPQCCFVVNTSRQFAELGAANSGSGERVRPSWASVHFKPAVANKYHPKPAGSDRYGLSENVCREVELLISSGIGDFVKTQRKRQVAVEASECGGFTRALEYEMLQFLDELRRG